MAGRIREANCAAPATVCGALGFDQARPRVGGRPPYSLMAPSRAGDASVAMNPKTSFSWSAMLSSSSVWRCPLLQRPCPPRPRPTRRRYRDLPLRPTGSPRSPAPRLCPGPSLLEPRHGSTPHPPQHHHHLFLLLLSSIPLPLSVNLLLPALAPPLLLLSTTGPSFPTPLPSGCGRGVGKLGPVPEPRSRLACRWGKDRRFHSLDQLSVPTRVPNRVPSKVPKRDVTLLGTQSQVPNRCLLAVLAARLVGGQGRRQR